MQIRTIINEDEKIAKYFFTGSYFEYQCIIPKDYKAGDDISGLLEMTLHRILENGGTEDDVLGIMGAVKGYEDEEYEEYIDIDLGYSLPGLLLGFIPETE